LEHRDQRKKSDCLGSEAEKLEVLEHRGIVKAGLSLERASGSRIGVGLAQPVDEFAILSPKVFFFPRAYMIGDSVLVYHGYTSSPALDRS
jgi:hypothetical protein